MFGVILGIHIVICQAAATFLTKATKYLAIGFMISSLSLAVTLRGHLGGGTVSEGLEGRQPSAATTAGEIVPQEGAPTELPGAATETEGEVEATGAVEQSGVTGDEIPVAPETE